MPDKFSATWISHSSISDYLACPRGYYLKHVYKNPKTGKKMKLMMPPLALGQAVHMTIDTVARLPKDRRFAKPLVPVFDEMWMQFTGKRGGFASDHEENQYKNRGLVMVRRVQEHPGPLQNPAIHLGDDLPFFWLSETEEIILCGLVDWIEYLPDGDALHIIDFKTGRNEEAGNSLQLPIYHLLVQNCQKRAVAKTSYWYLETSDAPVEQALPNLDEAGRHILDIGRKMKVARKLKSFSCPHDGCRDCRPLEAILRGEGEQVGVDHYGAEVFVLPPRS